MDAFVFVALDQAHWSAKTAKETLFLLHPIKRSGRRIAYWTGKFHGGIRRWLRLLYATICVRGNLKQMIVLKNVRKSFGEITAVDGLSFQIPTGKTFGLLGPNGAGKTTTIRMLVGALSPDSGTLEIDGEDASQPKVRARIGIAPQSLALYDSLTARENLKFFGELYGCLLYTSPSPRDATLSRMPSSA